MLENEKSFNVTLKTIAAMGEKLADNIHAAGMYAIKQVNEHGNDGFAQRLIDAMGKKQDVKRVEKWLCTFGKFKMKGTKLVYLARKDINETNLDIWLEKADATPFWELTEQEHHKFSVDYLMILKQAIKKHEKAEALTVEGKEVEEKNIGLLADIQALLAKHEMQPAVA